MKNNNGNNAEQENNTQQEKKLRQFDIKNLIVPFCIIISAIFLDLLTKFLVDFFMPVNGRTTLIKNFLYFYYVRNENAAFGSSFGLENIFGEGGVRVFFIIFTIIAVALFCYFLYLFRDRGRLVRFSLAMVIGGAIGNMYDRIRFGYVRDFVEIEYFGFDVPLLGRTFAIFNVADAFLTLGMIALIFYLLFKYPKQENQKKKEAEAAKASKTTEETTDKPTDETDNDTTTCEMKNDITTCDTQNDKIENDKIENDT